MRMLKPYKMFMVSALITLLVFNGCRQQKVASPIFEASFERSHTQDLKYYESSRIYCQHIFGDDLPHFPKKLKEKVDYEFLFTPRMFQSGAMFNFKQKFSSEKIAERYFKKLSNGKDVLLFRDLDDLEDNLYCPPPYTLGFPSQYGAPDSCPIILLYPSICSGNKDIHHPDFISGAILDLSDKVVVSYFVEYL